MTDYTSYFCIYMSLFFSAVGMGIGYIIGRYWEQERICPNCEEAVVSREGDWCDICNLPERGDIK